MPSGRALVLITPEADAVWGTSWQVSNDGDLMAVHAWPMAWNCSIFRNESAHLSSELIREAVAATRYQWGEPPAQGFVTFVDAEKVRPKRDPGRCYLRAGFRNVGMTGTGKVALLLDAADMPDAEAPLDANLELFAHARDEYQPRRRRVGIGGGFVDVTPEAGRVVRGGGAA